MAGNFTSDLNRLSVSQPAVSFSSEAVGSRWELTLSAKPEDHRSFYRLSAEQVRRSVNKVLADDSRKGGTF